jgi:transketolase
MLARAEIEPDHGMLASAVAVLWSQFLKFDAADPHWPDRDRCVVSSAHGAPALPASIEPSAGPLGQGVAMAVGMALAERMLAARFGRSLVDHRTWVIAGEDDLMQGISHEAASLAGHLRLEKLTVLCGDGDLSASCSDDLAKRFAACGWAVQRVDLLDLTEVTHALSFAIRCKKPTLIVCCTSGCADRAIAIAADVAENWEEIGSRSAGARRAWLKRSAHHPQRAEFERVIAGRLPESWHEPMAALKAALVEARPWASTAQASRRIIEGIAPAVAELVGGSTEQTLFRGMASVAPGQYGGRFVHCGSRDLGMAAAINGMALHGGMIPFGAADFCSADHMRPALRLAALQRLRVVHVLNSDGGGEGEQLAGLRAMPNLHLFRPADALETAECWELALRRAEGPSLIVLRRHKLPAHRSDLVENRSARGGYVLADADGARRATLIAGGAEVAIAMAARRTLGSEGIAAAVVSLPCWELFAQQDLAYRSRVLGAVRRFGIEADGGFGWERWLGEGGYFIGINDFAASAEHEELYRHFAMSVDALVSAVKRHIDQF